MDKDEVSEALPPSIKERLEEKFTTVHCRVKDKRLPGCDEYVEGSAKAANLMNNNRARVDRAIRDEDEVLFHRTVSEWEEGWDQINAVVAEKYRADNPDANVWELRYIKWMKKLKFIKFEGPMGIFYLVPTKPRRRPRAKHWFTVDEMIDVLESPGTLATIKAFGQLPIRPESLDGPKEGGKHLIINLVNKKSQVYYNFEGGLSRG